MGTPSSGKKFPPDVYCEDCGDILIGDEKKEKRCKECQRVINKARNCPACGKYLNPPELKELHCEDCGHYLIRTEDSGLRVPKYKNE